jgi:Kef-type K+ transport system membrane component KefB
LLVKSSRAGYLLTICFFFSALASILNINIIFGAFLAGIIINLTSKEEFKSSKGIVKEVSLALFIPLYFAIIGLKLDLIHNFNLLFFILFFTFATIIKTLGVFISARFAGQDNISSFNLATAMNARGGPGIVLATVTFEMGIINEVFFTTLVLFSIITSLISGLWLKRQVSLGRPLLKDELNNLPLKNIVK